LSIREKAKATLVWMYFLVLPYIVFYIVFYIRNLGEYERLALTLVLLGYVFLHKYMIIQFTEIIGEECE
jgi:hypothetical protein